MIKPFEIECGEFKFTKRNGVERVFPSISTTRWIYNGEDCQVFVNYSEKDEKITVKVDSNVKKLLVYSNANENDYTEVVAKNGKCEVVCSARNAVKAVIIK